MNYYHIEQGKSRMEKGFFNKRVNFWKELEWRSEMTSKYSLKSEL